MNITELLLKSDQKKFSEIPTQKYKSNVLSDIVGEDAYITLQVANNTELLRLSKKISDEDAEKQLETIKLICVLGIKEPDLKSIELKQKFGLNEKSTPIELLEKIWGGRQLELINIANAIMQLSGITIGDKEVKN